MRFRKRVEYGWIEEDMDRAQFWPEYGIICTLGNTFHMKRHDFEEPQKMVRVKITVEEV